MARKTVSRLLSVISWFLGTFALVVLMVTILSIAHIIH